MAIYWCVRVRWIRNPGRASEDGLLCSLSAARICTRASEKQAATDPGYALVLLRWGLSVGLLFKYLCMFVKEKV